METFHSFKHAVCSHQLLIAFTALSLTPEYTIYFFFIFLLKIFQIYWYNLITVGPACHLVFSIPNDFRNPYVLTQTATFPDSLSDLRASAHLVCTLPLCHIIGEETGSILGLFPKDSVSYIKVMLLSMKLKCLYIVFSSYLAGSG